MVNIFFNFLPFAVGIAISPIPIITVILALFSARAKWNGPAFLLGWALGIAVVSIPVLMLTDSSKIAPVSNPSEIASIIRIVLGAVLLFSAARHWKNRPKPGEAGSIPKWLLIIDTISPIKVLGVGFFFADLTNPKNTALTVAGTLTIAHSGLPAAGKAAMTILFILISCLGIAIPVFFYLAGGVSAKKILDGWKAWLMANNNGVMAIMFLIFGLLLISNGIQGLIG